MATEVPQEYPAMLAQLQPAQAASILQDRVHYIGRLNAAIAGWLQERRKLEEQYSAGLRRLAQRPLEMDLGVFSGPWSTLMSSADILADSHSAFATKIQIDAERPLREFATSNEEMRGLAISKEVERVQQNPDKMRERFESLQTVDEARVGNLRAALTQYQTHEMDEIERNRTATEQCLSLLLTMDTSDEIKTFAQTAVQNKPPLPRAQRSSVSYSSPSRGIQPSATNPLAQAPSRSEEDLTRERTASTDEGKQKSRLKGLKRFGTVMGRKRESKLPANAISPSESPAPRPRPSPFRFGRSKDQAPTLETMEERSPPLEQRPSMPPQLGSEIFQSPLEARADPATPRGAVPIIDSLPQTNGMPLAASIIPAAATTFASGSQQDESRDIDAPSDIIPQRKESLAALEGRTDSEGFSIPTRELDPISQAQQDAAFADEGTTPQYNVNIRDTPIQEDAGTSEADLASVANKLQAPPPSTKRASTVRGRRQDRNSYMNSAFAPPEQPIAESEPQPSPFATREVSEPAPVEPAPLDTAAPVVQSPVDIAGTGLVQSPSSSFAPGQLAASTFSPFSPQSEQPPPIRPDSRTAVSTDQPRGDTQSIRSATTTGSQGGIRHPDFIDSGLNSSIVETISARFENGKLASSSLIGEIALAYNPADFSSPFGNENIRIENFSSLEKVAPNPAFIKQIPDRDGEYSVNLSSIARTQIAFKYQVRLEDDGSHAPLLVTPAFKIEQNQCSIIVSYSLNPAFALNGQESISLSNVMLALTLEGTKATGCQSRPVGTFSKEKNLIYWQLNDVKLSPGAAPEKVLARFATESEAKSGSVEARWEITGENAQNLGSGLSLSMQASSGGDGSDPFADDSIQSANWMPVQGVRKLTSGTYLAK